MVYAERPKRSDSSSYSSGGSLMGEQYQPTYTPRRRPLTPEEEAERDRRREQMEQARAEEQERRFIESLPTYDLGGFKLSEQSPSGRGEEALKNSATHQGTTEGETTETKDKNSTSKTQQAQTKEEEKKKKKKKLDRWLPWLNRDKNDTPKGDNNQAKKPNSTRTNTTQTPQTKSTPQQSNPTTTASPTTANQQSQTQNTNKDSAPTNTTSETKATESLNQTATAPTIPTPKSERTYQALEPSSSVLSSPIFLAPDLNTADQLNRDNIIGKSPDGGILYTSTNPSDTIALAQEKQLPTTQLDPATTTSFYAQQQTNATAAISGVRTRAEAAGTKVSVRGENSIATLTGQSQSLLANITQQIALQKQTITDVMAESRNNAVAKAQTSIASVTQKHAVTITAIESGRNNALSLLETQYSSALSRIDSVANASIPQIEGELASSEQFFAQQQQRWFNTIDISEQGYINQFSKQAPDQSDNAFGRWLESWDRETYVTNWRKAKIDAVSSVAAAFREETTNTFAQHHQTLAGYRTSVMGGTNRAIAKRKETLQEQYTSAKESINQQADTAINNANQNLSSSTNSINTQQQQILSEIDTTQEQALSQIDETGTSAISSFTTRSEILKKNLRQSHSRGIGNLDNSSSILVSSIGNLDGGNDPNINAAIPNSAEKFSAKIAELEAQTINDIDTGTNNAVLQLQELASSLSGGISSIGTNISQQQQQKNHSYTNSLAQITETLNNNFDTLATQTTASLEKVATVTSQNWLSLADTLHDDLLNVRLNLKDHLKTAESQVTAQKESFNLKLGDTIRTKATEAAAQVQPAWKKVVKIFVNVAISVAVTVAIAALALSGVGLVAGIGLAALIGAAGGVAKLGITNAIDGKETSAGDYLKAAGIGAATGVLEFVGGRLVVGMGSKLSSNILTKIEHTVASTAVEAVTNTAVEMTERLASGEDFTLALLGISVASSILSTAGGKYIDGAFGEIAEGSLKGIGKEGSEAVVEGVGLKATQFVSETAFDTAVETGASVARGEEVTWGSLGENVASGVMGRGVAGRADKLYGERLRGIGNSPTGNRRNTSSNNTNVTSRRSNDVEGVNNSSTRTNQTSRNNSTANNSSIDLSKQNDNSAPRQQTNRTSPQTNSSTPTTNLRRNPELEAYSSSSASNRVEVYSDPDLPGNTVRVEYQRAENGTITGVVMRAGEGATVRDIELHQHTAKVMRMYGGTLGRVRVVEAKIAKWLGIHGQPPSGTRAWEAQLEVPKLEGIISERMERLKSADAGEAVRLEADIENLQQQLIEHRQTFGRGDDSEGLGYVAAEGYADNHDHYGGNPDPEEFVSTLKKYRQDNGNDYPQIVRDLYDLLLSPEPPPFKTDEQGNPILNKKKNGFIPSEQVTKRNKTRNEHIKTLKDKLKQNGLFDEKGELNPSIEPQQAEKIVSELLSANDSTSFDAVYAFRRLFVPETYAYAKKVAQKMVDQEIEYGEFQGASPNLSKDKLLSTFATDKLQAWFLSGMFKGNARLTKKKSSELTKEDLKQINTLGERRNVGIDFLGEETKKFTDAGIEGWQNIYQQVARKAEQDSGTYVDRTHVGEGAPEIDESGNVAKDSPHKEIANHNAGKLVDTLVKMGEKNEFSPNVVTRLGHMTHADFEQLDKLSSLNKKLELENQELDKAGKRKDKKHEIIIEANLSSNLATRTVDDENEMHRVLLKFLYHDNLRVSLNTDGGGVMNTTIKEEYKIAQKAMDRFESGELPLIDEKGKTMYYYDKSQVPRKIPDKLLEYKHEAIPESKKENYNTDRLRDESDRYIDYIAPSVGSLQQRRDNKKSVNQHKKKNNQNSSTPQPAPAKKRKNTGGQKTANKKAK